MVSLFWRDSFNEKKMIEDQELISKFYRNNGYRDFKFIMDTLELSEDKTRMNIIMKVQEGVQYKYRNFTWEGCPFLMKIS